MLVLGLVSETRLRVECMGGSKEVLGKRCDYESVNFGIRNEPIVLLCFSFYFMLFLLGCSSEV